MNPPQLTQLASDLFVYHGAINTGILRDGDRALLIDCGAGDVADALPALGIARVERILFTHHHRDQASGAGPFVAQGARIGVPAAERDEFAHVERYWNDPAHRWHLYNFHPHNLMLARSIPVHDAYREGDVIRWGEATLTVLETPGHTEGSVTYRIDLPGGGRFLFSGDAIYDVGQIWELYSLQKGWEVRDYHGFLGARVLRHLPGENVGEEGDRLDVAPAPSRVRYEYDRHAPFALLERRVEGGGV